MDRMLWDISRQLFRVRSAAGRSQESVALEAELAVRTYRRLETGVAGSSIDSLLRAMIALNINRLDLTPVSANVVGPGVSAVPRLDCPKCRIIPARGA